MENVESVLIHELKFADPLTPLGMTKEGTLYHQDTKARRIFLTKLRALVSSWFGFWVAITGNHKKAGGLATACGKPTNL
jgi:hypothetical protein